MSVQIINGTDMILVVAGEMVAHAKSHTISMVSEFKDVSSKSSGVWKDKMAMGRMDWSAKCDGLVSYDQLLCNYEALYDAMITRTAVTLVSCIRGATTPETPKPTTIVYTGSAWITSLEKTAADQEAVTFSVSFEGDGALAKTTAAA